MDFLQGSQFEVLLYQAVTEEIFRLQDQRDDNLAIRIANAVSNAFKVT